MEFTNIVIVGVTIFLVVAFVRTVITSGVSRVAKLARVDDEVWVPGTVLSFKPIDDYLDLIVGEISVQSNRDLSNTCLLPKSLADRIAGLPIQILDDDFLTSIRSNEWTGTSSAVATELADRWGSSIDHNELLTELSRSAGSRTVLVRLYPDGYLDMETVFAAPEWLHEEAEVEMATVSGHQEDLTIRRGSLHIQALDPSGRITAGDLETLPLNATQLVEQLCKVLKSEVLIGPGYAQAFLELVVLHPDLIESLVDSFVAIIEALEAADPEDQKW